MKKRGMSGHFIFGLLLLLAITLALVGCKKTNTSETYTLKVASKAGIGSYLVNGKGMTLYYNTGDESGQSNVSASSLNDWPPVIISTFSVPSSLNKNDFSNTSAGYGQSQTTYKGWPLYYFINDKKAGDTLGNGVEGKWFVVIPTTLAEAP